MWHNLDDRVRRLELHEIDEAITEHGFERLLLMLAVRTEKTLTELHEQVTAIATAVTGLATDVTELTTAVADIGQRLESLPPVPGEIPQEDLDALRSTGTSLTDLATRVDEATAQLNTLATNTVPVPESSTSTDSVTPSDTEVTESEPPSL